MPMFIRLIFLSLGLWIAGASFSEAAQTVTEIRIESRDRQPMDPSVAMGFIGIRVGDEVTHDALTRDVRLMQRSGRFSFVAADLQPGLNGATLIYTVEVKPRIRRLTVTGAEYLSNRKVADLLELKAGDLVDDATLATRAQAVRAHYRTKRFPSSELSWTITVDADSGTADVNVRVREGPRTKVKAITFKGNDAIDARTLRRLMKQDQRGFFSWITGSGRLNPDELAADTVELRRAFQRIGYLDAIIAEPELKEDTKGRVAIRIPVEQGPQYRFGEITISGATLFDDATLLRLITNRPGDIASSDAIQTITRNLRDYYGSRGYVDTQVSPQISPDFRGDRSSTNPVVNVHFTIREGTLAFIRNIRFRGNTKTRDKVLRREVTVYPGEVMNEVKLRTSENRLRNLGLFSSVSFTEEPTLDPEKFDAVFDVQEQSTGQFMVGAGFSSIDNLIGFIELQQSNFDLANWPPTGGGQKLRMRAQLGTKRNDVEVSLTEPWFLDRRLSLGGSLFRRNARFYSDEYRQRNTGGNLTLAFPLPIRFSRLNLIYGLEEIRVYDVDERATDIIKQEEGRRIKSSLTAQYVYDSRNNAFIPTQGTRISLSVMGAGSALGGDTEIYGSDLMVSRFWPLWFDHVFSIRGWIAGVDSYGDSERVPIFDRLFLGGARTLRGFKFREVGPKDDQGEPVGGNSLWFASAEYTIPLERSIRFAFFYDIGMVYEKAFDWDFSEYNSDVGIGLRFDIPGFPLRFDYAWPLETDKFNDRSSGRFQFSIGYSF